VIVLTLNYKKVLKLQNKYISNKILIIRIVLFILIISVFILFISTEYLKNKAVDTLAEDDAHKTAQLVFETMNTRMQEGWTKEDLDKIIKRLEIVRSGMTISSYRSKQVEDLFGVIPENKKIIDSDPLIQKAMNGEEIFLINKESGEARFLYPMKTTTECNHCHINAVDGSINGVLDIRFPENEIMISLDVIFTYVIVFFIVFLLILAYFYFVIINKKMVQPIVKLTNNIVEIQASKDLTQRVNINTNITELALLQSNFNSLLITIKYYYDKLIQKIYTDDLTSINNLTKLQYDLETKNNNLSIILLDIKSFSKLHKVYGNRVSDFILKQFTKNINTILNHDGVVYRLYMDQFAIVYNKNISEKDVEDFASSLKSFVYEYKNSEFILDLTIGYAYGTNKNALENATLALKEAKKMKCNIFQFDDKISVQDEDTYHMIWLDKLNSAINNNQIVPYFMPLYHTKSKKINKYETLVRIVENGTVHTPDKFLDIAISSGKYHIITQTVIKKAFEYFKDINDIKFSINIALSDITNDETMDILFENLKNYKYSENVVIELLETEEIADFDLLNNFIQKVKKHKSKVAIDDFGSGYSNFNYIINLDIDIVKLDSSLIENMYTDQHAVVIVSNIVKIIKELGLEVVAEKVFSEEIASILTIHEIDYLQGFHIGKAEKDILK